MIDCLVASNSELVAGDGGSGGPGWKIGEQIHSALPWFKMRLYENPANTSIK